MTSKLFLFFTLSAVFLMTSTYAQCNTSMCNSSTTFATTVTNTTVPFTNLTTTPHFSNQTVNVTMSTTTGKPAQSSAINVNYVLALIATFFAIVFLK